MKILMLNHEFPPVGGGAAPVTLELCKHLVETGHEVDVVTMHFKGTARFEVIDGVNVYRTPAIRKKPNICHTHEMATYLPGALFKTLSLCRKRKYDIIHCHFVVPGAPLAWLVSRLTKIPYIVTCHGTDVPGHNPDRFQLMHKIVGPAWRFFAKGASLLTSPSESLKKLILKNSKSVDVRVIPNGIYTEDYFGGQKQKSILMCSRMFEFKGFQYAIDAVKDMDTDWEVNVIGQGPYLDELKKRAQGSKVKITFWGWLDKDTDDKFKELYRSSSIFVFPSEAENFPTVLLEAMSASMAVVTSTAGGCPEVVGDAGLLVPPRDVDAIREAVTKLIDDDQYRQSKAQQSLKRVEKFSWPIVTEKYLQAYQQVIDRNK